MNNIAILPHIAKHTLQNQNIKRNMVKKADIRELNDEPVTAVDPISTASTDNTTSETSPTTETSKPVE